MSPGSTILGKDPLGLFLKVTLGSFIELNGLVWALNLSQEQVKFVKLSLSLNLFGLVSLLTTSEAHPGVLRVEVLQRLQVQRFEQVRRVDPQGGVAYDLPQEIPTAGLVKQLAVDIPHVYMYA